MMYIFSFGQIFLNRSTRLQKAQRPGGNKQQEPGNNKAIVIQRHDKATSKQANKQNSLWSSPRTITVTKNTKTNIKKSKEYNIYTATTISTSS